MAVLFTIFVESPKNVMDSKICISKNKIHSWKYFKLNVWKVVVCEGVGYVCDSASATLEVIKEYKKHHKMKS